MIIMMKNQCGSCKKLVKLADMVNNTCPKCGQPFRMEEVAESNVPALVAPIENAMVVVEPAAMVPVITAAVENNDTELVVAGKRGVTNFQMIPVLKNAIDADDVEKINALNAQYPAVFASSFKYIGKDRQAKLETLLGSAPVENREIPEYNGAPLVNNGKYGVSNFQMIPVLKNAVDENDVEKIQMLKQYFPAVFTSTAKYIGKDRQAKLETIVA